MWMASFPRTICWKDCPFFTECSWHTCWKISWPCMWVFISGSILIHWSMCLSYASSTLHPFNFYSFVVSFEVVPTLWEFFNFYSSFSRLFWPFEAPCNFYLCLWGSSFSFYEEVSWTCHRNCCTYRSCLQTNTFISHLPIIWFRKVSAPGNCDRWLFFQTVHQICFHKALEDNI